MFGNQVLRVFFFEKGTLLPYSFVFPWKRPSWDRLKGRDTASKSLGILGNIAAGSRVGKRATTAE